MIPRVREVECGGVGLPETAEQVCGQESPVTEGGLTKKNTELISQARERLRSLASAPAHPIIEFQSCPDAQVCSKLGPSFLVCYHLSMSS